MSDANHDFRRIAVDLFEKGRIDVLVGFEKGNDGYRSRPAFVKSAEQAQKLTWDSTCSQNLAVYLPGIFRSDGKVAQAQKPPRAAFVTKACDLRSIIALVKEKQAPRESLTLIGMPCRGMIDARKAAGAAGADILRLEDQNDRVEMTLADGRTVSMDRETIVQDACRDCCFPSAEGADITVEGACRSPAASEDSAVREFEKLPVEERWKKFSTEMSRCIRCYACRQACPTCYCTECFAETNSPAWVGVTTELTDTMIFHLIRVFHQAGRCVECDACVRACPEGIDLRPFTKKIAADVRAMFGFTPGFDVETPPPLVTFAEDDGQDFISEPRKG
ncbi:MAG TPA: 4Fe-4S dicluster domain-containing protein [Spirochaetia bacterium]|nr:4Fe-4S dicluster domain-containing protein [Spirochaetia bacterium]